MHQFIEAPSLRSLRADTPPALEELVTTMLAKRPEQRPRSMMAVAAALQPFADAAASNRRPTSHPNVPLSGTATSSLTHGELGSARRAPRRRWVLIVTGLIVAVVGVAILAVAMLRRMASLPKVSADARELASPPATLTMPRDAALPVYTSADLLARAHVAMDAKQWSHAAGFAQQAIDMAPNAEAQEIAAEAGRELRRELESDRFLGGTGRSQVRRLSADFVNDFDSFGDAESLILTYCDSPDSRVRILVHGDGSASVFHRQEEDTRTDLLHEHLFDLSTEHTTWLVIRVFATCEKRVQVRVYGTEPAHQRLRATCDAAPNGEKRARQLARSGCVAALAHWQLTTLP